MATTRIKDISKTTTDLASDTYGVFDGATNGTQKMARNDMYADWAAAYVAAPTTYKLAPLNSGTNKIDATYLPTSGDTPKGEWNASTNSPSLADGSGTAGDYYDVTTAGTQNLGSGSITFTVGDVVKYNGSTWFKIDSVANILDGSATAADGRSALSVNSIEEDAQAYALKTTAPALYFNGSSYVTVADDDKLTFSSSVEFGTTSSGTWSPNDNTPALTDGSGTLNQHYRVDIGAGTVTQGGSTLSVINGTATTAGQAVYYDGAVWRLKDVDDLPFSIAYWNKPTSGTVVGKVVTTATGEWHIAFGSGVYRLYLWTDASNYIYYDTEDLSAFLDEWCHACFTVSGAGPNSDYAFGSAQVSFYLNGQPKTVSQVAAGTYAGMSNKGSAVRIGQSSWNGYFKGSIRDVKIFNRELTATEIAQLARGNDLGFADEWGGAHGAVYTQDATPSGEWTGVAGTDADETGPIGGKSNVLKFTVDTASAVHYISQIPLTAGKRYNIVFDYYIPSGQSNVDGIRADVTGVSSAYSAVSPTLDAWNRANFDVVPTGSTLQIIALDGGATTFQDAGGDDVFYISECKITEIGCLADFRSERYDTSTKKLYCLSDNAFVGTGTSVSLTGREVPVYETGTWTPSITFGGGSTGITYTTQEGSYIRNGSVVYVAGVIVLSAVGSDTGSAKIEGLPFTSKNLGARSEGVTIGLALGMASLTSAMSAIIEDSTANIILYDWGASGSVNLTESNFTATSQISFSATYQIQ